MTWLSVIPTGLVAERNYLVALLFVLRILEIDLDTRSVCDMVIRSDHVMDILLQHSGLPIDSLFC